MRYFIIPLACVLYVIFSYYAIKDYIRTKKLDIFSDIWQSWKIATFLLLFVAFTILSFLYW